MKLDRRTVLRSGLAAAATLAAPAVLGQAKPRIVVIGGGAGGATAARYLAKDSNGAWAVTLVEENEVYHTCFHSNLYLGGFKSYGEITHRYDALTDRYGVALARALASSGLAVDFAIHEDGMNHNPHAHLMMTTRAIGPAGFGKKLRGADDKAFLQQTRALWAKIVNQALGQVGAAVMVDHRSHAARGIERAAGDHRGIDRTERQLRREARDQAGQDMDRASQAIRDAMARSQADMRRFPQLAAREDWPPAVRTPPAALTRDEREEYRAYWREVDKRMFRAEREIVQNRDIEEARAEALKPGPERQAQVERVRASVERDTMPDMGSEALRQYGEMQERVNQAFAARGITVENNIDVAALNAQMQQLRNTLFDIRMRELQAIDRDQERERLLPVPGPDRMPISPAERDQAQERMTAEVEREDYPQTPRPQERTSLADFRDRREPVARQPERSPETAARSLADWRAQRQQAEAGRDRDDPEHSREPDLERDR